MENKNFFERMKMNIDDLSYYYMVKRKEKFDKGVPLRGINILKLIHFIPLSLIKIDKRLEHEKITVRFTCSINSYKDLTRHRAGTAFSIESTRYCNYSKDKFGNNIKFINPVYITDPNNYATWKECMKHIETFYMVMANNKATPDQCRTMLPHSVAAEVCMTFNIREWRHILGLRCSKMVHPEIRQILIPLLLKFKQDMPELFNNIPYDEDFPKEWYAEIKTMEE